MVLRELPVIESSSIEIIIITKNIKLQLLNVRID